MRSGLRGPVGHHRARALASNRRPISELSVSPAPPSPGCNRPGKAATFDKQGFGPDGVRQLLVEYRSPVLPNLKRPIQAYLTLPPGYTPSGSYPAVLVTHGHHDNEKESTARCLHDSDHADALQLAEHGAITLAPDTITFGDYDTFEGENALCGGILGDVGSHHEAVCTLRIGTMMQRYVIDNMVRVSLLETIPGGDWGRVYTAGLSLGGWQALWTAALDRRVSRVVAAGIFKRLDKMEWQSADDLCQTIPALSTAFLAYGSLPSLLIPQLITQQSMLITTPDIAALIFGHAALLSTWNMKDSGWSQVGDTLTDTTRAATETGGTYLSEIAPRLLEASIPDSHEFYSFMPTPGMGPVQPRPHARGYTVPTRRSADHGHLASSRADIPAGRTGPVLGQRVALAPRSRGHHLGHQSRHHRHRQSADQLAHPRGQPGHSDRQGRDHRGNEPRAGLRSSRVLGRAMS